MGAIAPNRKFFSYATPLSRFITSPTEFGVLKNKLVALKRLFEIT